jgi:YD repeat-containing protein
MTSRTVNGVTYTQTFDAENRLKTVTVNGQTTSFYYDANGQRVLTIQPNGTKIYTPFTEFEETVTTTGGIIQRRHYYLAGQLVAVRVITGSSNDLYYAYTDHLGNVNAWTDASGGYIANSTARYEPFGGFRTVPTTNPAITDRGFTGHKDITILSST